METYLQRQPYGFEVQKRVMQVWNEVAPCRVPREARNNNTDGAPEQPYLQRHPYAFEVQERVIAWWDEVVQFRDPG